MKGYKGFSPGMVCLGKQYAENTTFEEERAEMCQKGMHFCENPLNVLDYYGFVNKDAEINEFAEVEADEAETEGNKSVTKKLRVGAKIGIPGLVRAFVEYTIGKIDKTKKEANTGYRSAATNTGDRSAATNTGDYSAATNTGDYSAATNTGYRSAATNTGYQSAATNTGYQSAATNTGDYSAATNTGYRSAATNTGDYSAATNTGYQSAATNTGDYSAATNTGNQSAASVKGTGSVAMVTGYQSKAKGELGCAIVICERGEWDGNDYPLLSIKSGIIDGKRLKPDVWYTVKNGRFVRYKE